MRVSRMPGRDSFMAVTTAIVTVAVLIAALIPGQTGNNSAAGLIVNLLLAARPAPP